MARSHLLQHTGLSKRGAAVTRVGAALIAGQVAGLLFVLCLMVTLALTAGRPLLFPLHVIGALVLGPGALEHPTAGTALVGLLFNQLVPSLAWSAIYGLVAATAKERLNLNHALMLGFIMGGFAVVVGVYLVLPPFQKAITGANVWGPNIPKLWDWVAHGVYGLSLGGLFWLLRNRLETAWLMKHGVAKRAWDPEARH
jgi:hypothetical protein